MPTRSCSIGQIQSGITEKNMAKIPSDQPKIKADDWAKHVTNDENVIPTNGAKW